jgi:hypothetical protein
VMDQRHKMQVAPRAGFEPATNRLTAGCSTAELPGTKAQARARRRAYNKSDRAVKAPSEAFPRAYLALREAVPNTTQH